MNTVQVALEKVNSNVAISNISKVPVLDMLEIYWTDENKKGWVDFLRENNFEVDKIENIKNLNEVVEFSNYSFEFLKNMNAKGKIGKLDFRLAPVLKPRFLSDFKMEEFQTISLDISSFENEEAKKVIKEIFKEVNTNAFIDFKEIVDDKLYYTYNRKGLLFDGDRFSIATARERINLTEDYKSAKDNNFVSARLILEMSKLMVERGLAEALFSTTIITPTGSYDKTHNSKEIVKLSLMSQEEKEELKEAEQIKKAAAQEIKDANNLTRTSLSPESNMAQINKAQPELRINNSFTVKINYSDGEFFKELFEKYEQIQIEVIKKKLRDAKENGHKAYATLKAHINQGLPIFEALNIVKQEFRDEEVVRFASFLLTKDLLDLSKVEGEVETLKIELTEVNAQNDNLSLALAKKDTTIKEMQGTITRKSNEINLLKEEYTNELELMKKEAESKIKMIQEGFNAKIQEANGIIEDQEKLISKLQVYEESHKTIGQQLEQIQTKNQVLNVENASMKEKLNYLEAESKRLKQENEKLINQLLKGLGQKEKNVRVGDILGDIDNTKHNR